MSGIFNSSISGTLDSIRNNVSSSIDDAQRNPVLGKALDIVDPGRSRLALSGLLKGGARAGGVTGATPNVRFSAQTTDWRIRISLAQGADYFYRESNAGILEPLKNTNGVIFPYTPQISVTHSAKYGSTNLTHSNYTNYFYEGSEVQAISVSSEFTVQNSEEGRYVLACIQFFRSATKMFFGQGTHIGHPPPMVFLNGYGNFYFPNVPCVITSFQHTMPADVDYVNVTSGGTTVVDENTGARDTIGSDFVRLPTSSTITVSLQPIYTRRNLTNFDLNEFAKGKLLGGGFI